MHWTGTLPDNTATGFVYAIVRKIDNRIYVGQKSYRSITTKKVPLKSDPTRKKNTKVIKESQWQTYTGSSVELNSDIQKMGKEAFDFIILENVTGKGKLNRIEAFKQIELCLDKNFEFVNTYVKQIRLLIR